MTSVIENEKRQFMNRESELKSFDSAETHRKSEVTTSKRKNSSKSQMNQA